ncbi:MAG: hypothetical protein Q7J69_03550, partial [Candidatus Omnitrophota bacterium]|nr:hypothetical protein [Candidatus Omnitrophota bacterium]
MKWRMPLGRVFVSLFLVGSMVIPPGSFGAEADTQEVPIQEAIISLDFREADLQTVLQALS